MISSIKTKVLIFITTAALLLGGLAVLNHHPMSMTTSDHSECNTTCKIACFSQSIVNGITAPIQLDSLLFVLPLINLSLMLILIFKAIKDNSYTFRYSHGPPLYKQFESYRY